MLRSFPLGKLVKGLDLDAHGSLSLVLIFAHLQPLTPHAHFQILLMGFPHSLSTHRHG